MVDLTRRKTVIGLGLLATGSGATFTSAAFSSSTTPGSDIRVVAAQQLTVRDQDVSSISNVANATDAGTSPSDYLFNTSGTTSDAINRTNINYGDVSSNGEAAVNNATNDQLEFAIALSKNQSTSFEFLEVANNGDVDADVGIGISQYGDVTSVSGIGESEVDDAFDFQIGDGSGGFSGANQIDGLNESVTVPVGDVRPIKIGVDLSASAIGVDGASGSSNSDNVFGSGAAVDTVDLVDAIEVGLVS